MKRNILIVEDKPLCIEAIVKIIDDISHDIDIVYANSVEEAYKILANRRIHLFLLDIILDNENAGDVSGLFFAEELRKSARYKYTPIVFITSLEDPKLYTYSQLHCYDFIEKPFDYSRVKDTIAQALEVPLAPDGERYIYFRKEGIIYSKQLQDVILVESSRRKVCIYCKSDKIEIPYKTMDEILQELDSERFVRCSRYTVLNRDYIEHIDYVNRLVKLKYIEKPVEIGVIMGKLFKQSIENG